MTAPPRRPSSATRGLLLAGALEAGALAALGWIPGARGTPLPALALWALAFLAYLEAARRAGSGAGAPGPLVWGIGIGMRLALLPLAPHFSDDIFRYLWDGWVQTQGVGPYLHPPADPALSHLRTSWHALINHPEIRTIYPPGAQLAFAGLARLAATVPLFKAAWVACDLAVAWILSRLAAPRRAGTVLLLWLWSPLLLVEVAWSGHMEPLGILPMMLAVWWLRGASGTGAGPDAREGRDRPAATGRGLGSVLGGAALGLAASVKLAPVAAVPALFRRHGWRAAALAVAVPVLLYVPFLGAGADLFSGLAAYAERWEFDAGVFRLLAAALGDRPARLTAAGLAVAVALGAAARRWPVPRALYWCLGAGLLLSPTLHPWYVLWILPFAALAGSPAWILLSGLVFLGYWGRDLYFATGRWPQPAWLAAAVHGPVLLLLLREWFRKRADDGTARGRGSAAG